MRPYFPLLMCARPGTAASQGQGEVRRQFRRKNGARAERHSSRGNPRGRRGRHDRARPDGRGDTVHDSVYTNTDVGKELGQGQGCRYH